MVVTPEWKLFLAESKTFDLIGELRGARSRSLKFALDEGGSCNFNLRIDDPLAYQLSPWETCILAQRNDDIKWSGPITNFNSRGPEDIVSVSANGWFERLMKRQLLTQVVYNDIDAGLIAHDLLDITNEYSDTYITKGFVQASQLRDRTFLSDVVVGNEIKQLSQVESGFDFEVDPKTKQFNIYTKRGMVKENVVFGYNTFPHNLTSFGETVDGSVVVNDIRARGANATGFADDQVSIARYGMLQEVQSLSDVVDTDILIAYANAEIVYRGNPRTIYDFNPKQTGAPGTYLPFDDYNLGDTVYVSAERGRIQVSNQAVRVFAFDINIGDDGAEQITNLQTSAS